MRRETFEVLGIASAAWAHPGIATAVARAGGVGLLDLEFCVDPVLAERNFLRLAESTEGRVGLRLTRTQAGLARRLLDSAGDRPLTLVLAGPPATQTEAYEALSALAIHRILAEVTDVAAPAALAYPHDGLIAKGHEAGGWVGADTAYILAQKLLGEAATTRKPVYVQGAIGVHGAAACRILGAAGVVLEDQMLLLAESPLPEALQTELARLNGAETRLFGELIDSPCRVYARPASPALKQADEDGRKAESGELAPDEWRSLLNAQIGWSARGIEVPLLPLGQGIGVAAIYRTQYRSVGRLVQALRRTSLKQIESAAAAGFLGEGGALAVSHGTRYSLAQGPMTRVSDSPEFAYEVSRHGALPFLALALMRGPQVLEMLQQTQRLMTQGEKELPWGVGMLGFVPQSMREEQCEAIWQCKPPFALIAGGRPDQAAEFEQRGIATYIHAPAPALLKMYMEQGARRFVFEGRECGGHIGPLASFALWEQMVEVLLEQVPAAKAAEYHVLFAGGVHDARSGAMLAALTAPLAARGIKVGALMGTAYLFTEEIVSSGAVVEGFRDAAIGCERTVNYETGPGHSTRCVDTPFFRQFLEARKQLLKDGQSGEDIRNTLEEMNMGRMRIASKGLNRDASGVIVEVAPEAQFTDGMYMVGQVATLRERVQTVAELHRDATEGATELLRDFVEARAIKALAAKPADIAIIGVGTLLPKAQDAEKYWENILDKVCVIGEVPKSRWDWKLYFDADRNARDKVYSRWGGFLDEVAFDPISYGIPPRSMKSIDPMQLLTLEVARRALADAGMSDGNFDRENTSIILGTSGGLGDLGTQYAVRSELPRFVENPDMTVWERLPEWTEESFAGSLPNVSTGRVANRLDLGGLNFTVDAACASSLTAIAMAVNELESGRSNVAIAGGVDTVQSPFGFLCFSKTQALSPTGKPKTFDVDADGIAISEGLAVVVLKRLADAERDGDRIYAVIKSMAGSSDGKALGMTAPRPEGQKLALKRAYARAGFSPATLGMAEAHGTGTPVGDRAEARTITETLIAEGAAPKTCAIGSVKTLLGHTKASAGVAGLIKVALALHHRTLPAHYGVDKPIDTIADPASPVYLLKEPRPWLANPDFPRRGSVSAFGFGGTNFHAVLEEHRDDGAAPAGAARWPQELCVFHAADEAALATELGRLSSALRQGTNLKLRDLAHSLARSAQGRPQAPLRLAVVAKDLAGLATDLEAVAAHLGGNGKPLPASSRLGRGLGAQAPALAFLFPGQGAQYVDMGRETALYIDELRGALEFADITLRTDFPNLLSRSILPPAAFDAEAEAIQTQTLTDTRVAQPAIGALALGYLRLAERLGLVPMAVAGHSYGEYAALHAAGVLGAADFLRLSAIRGRCMAEAARSSAPGAMAAVQADRTTVMRAIGGLAGVRLANHNAPEQAVISGPVAGVETAMKALADAGVRVTRLPVSGAFHTELVAGAQIGLSAAIQNVGIATPRLPVYSNTTGRQYPDDATGIRRTLDGHLLNSVEFVAEIEAMYAAGARVFVELGPRGVCANMTKATLAGRDAIAVSLDGQGGGLRGLLLGLAELVAVGVPVALTRLFESRDPQTLELGRLAELVKPVALPKHAWWIGGGAARPLDDPMIRTGKLPALDFDTAAVARENAQRAAAANVQHIQPAAVVAAPAHLPTNPAGLSPMLGGMGGEAWAAYQQTMRQFLSLQERVIQQALGMGTALPASLPERAPPNPLPATAFVATLAPAAATPIVSTMLPESRLVAAGPAFDAGASLLEIVAERTGYPTGMLGLEQDLEAELGIDSIKRVEILGAFQRVMPAAMGAQMQAAMERFTRAKTLTAILAEAARLEPAPAVAAAAPEGTPILSASAAPTVPATVFDAKAALLGIVAERTGYPTDLLGLDADLEADLGIDSIKRVEILGAIQKILPGATGAAMQARMERFTKARSLALILGELAVLPGGAPVAAPGSGRSPAPVFAPMPVAAPAFDARAALLDVVAERTGYPTDMLGLDADLEADLGIDSIKRVEILGALQKLLPAEVGAGMQAKMERFTKARSLQAILRELAVLAPATGTASAAAATTAPNPAEPAKHFNASAILIELVVERTGYPAEMLGLEADLEADLGIDSIKRVEILGALQKALPGELGARMQAAMEPFTRARSLSGILAQLAALAPAPAAGVGSPLATPAAARPLPPAPLERLPRFAVKSVRKPLADRRANVSGLALILGGPADVVTTLKAELSGAGLTPFVLAATEPAELVRAIEQAESAHGPAQALLHLHGLAAQTIDSGENLAAWRRLGAATVLSLFHAAKFFGERLGSIRVLAATRLGGTLGRIAFGPGPALAGGVCGLTNCMQHEYPGIVARTIDFDGQTEAEIGTLLAAELLAEDRETEAGYIGLDRYGSGAVLCPAEDTAFAPHLAPQAGWILLATGGARGITAEILEELAVPGLTLILIGRTAEPGAENAATEPLASASALRKTLIAAALAHGDKPKPAEIDRAVKAILVDREIRSNLVRLRARGANVEYLACDVRDEAAFGALIDALYAKHGRIDLVIHGAGVIEDKLIKDKATASFERVFGTKLDPLFVMQKHLRPDSLKALALFSSVAGRYGNRGQADYAAANEAMNRIAWSLSRAWPQTRVVSINWGPWDAGMAASDAVKQGFREKGAVPIPVPQGRRYFLDELAWGSRVDVEVVAGEGPWRALGAGAPEAVPAVAALRPSDGAFPLIRGATRMGPGGNMTLDHVFNLQSDPYLIDHRMDGKAVLPAAGALEYMAQFVSSAWPGWQVAEMRDFKQFNGVMLEGGKRAVQLRARASSHSDLNGQTVTVEIIDPERKLPFYRATAVLLQALPEASVLALEPLTEGQPFSADAAYSNFLFHGPRLQLVMTIDRAGPAGIDAAVMNSRPADWLVGAQGQWLFDPGLVDVPPQLAMVWSRLNRDMSALPSRFGAVRRFGAEPLPSRLALAFRLRTAPHAAALAYDALFVDAQSRARLEFRDCESTMSEALNRLGGQAGVVRRGPLGNSGESV